MRGPGRALPCGPPEHAPEGSVFHGALTKRRYCQSRHCRGQEARGDAEDTIGMQAKIRGDRIKARLADYGRAVDEFTWDQAHSRFSWSQTGKLNIVYEAVDRWALSEDHSFRPALIWDHGGIIERFSFREAFRQSCRWANLLEHAGLRQGGRVLTLLEPNPETIWVQLAAARLGAVYCHLRPGLSNAAYKVLLGRLRPDVVVTTAQAPASVWKNLPRDCSAVYISPPATGRTARQSLAVDLLPHMDNQREPVWLEPGDIMQLSHAESPEGPPRLAATSHEAMIGHLMTAEWVLNLGPGSVFWADSHPSGAVFFTYGVWGALLCGACSLLATGQISPQRRREILLRHKITTWYTAPLMIRGLMAQGDDPDGAKAYADLEHIATVGQRLDMEQFFWMRNNFGRAPHETWWTVETGMICVANLPATDIKLGSIGRPVPGVEARVLDGLGRPQHLLTVGELSLKTGWPAMSQGYLDDGLPPRLNLYDGRWLQTGDMAVYDEDGYLYLQGRQDDLIRGQGRMVGPFEIEHALANDSRVAEAAAVASLMSDGQPALKAFVALQPGENSGDAIRRELLGMLASNVSPDGPLSGLEILERLPRNKEGKLLRRALRALDLGLPLGDVTGLP